METSTIAMLILVAIVVLYVTEIIPLSVSSVLGALAMGAFGVIPFKDAISPFGSDTVMLVVGMLILGNALFETGLVQRIGTLVVKMSNVGERVMLAVIIIIAAILSAFMSNTATVAMFMPLIATAAIKSGGKITKKNTFMALGFASVLGGNFTLVGSTPQLVAQGILKQQGYAGLDFFTLAAGAIPLVIITVVYFLTFGYKLQKKVFDFPETYDVDPVQEEAEKNKPKSKMIIAGSVLAICIVLFIMNKWPIGIICLAAGCVLILTRCISEKTAFAKMDWSSIAILGGALGYSKGLDASGAGEIIANTIINWCGGEAASPFILFCAIIVISTVLSNLMSNTAVTAMLTPIGLYMSRAMGMNPMAMAIGIIYSASLALSTPVGTTPVTLTLAGGYRFNDYVKVGGILNVLCMIGVIVFVPLIYGLM